MRLYDVDKEISFISRHYKKGLFAIEPALRKIKSATHRWWTFPKIAAASLIFIVIGATAAVLVRQIYFSETSEIDTTQIRTVAPELISRVIDFDDAPLTVVLDQIMTVYGVEVVNVPDNADDYHLSLHYEGSAADLVETINDILGTNLKIKS